MDVHNGRMGTPNPLVLGFSQDRHASYSGRAHDSLSRLGMSGNMNIHGTLVQRSPPTRCRHISGVTQESRPSVSLESGFYTVTSATPVSRSRAYLILCLYRSATSTRCSTLRIRGYTLSLVERGTPVPVGDAPELQVPPPPVFSPSGLREILANPRNSRQSDRGTIEDSFLSGGGTELVSSSTGTGCPKPKDAGVESRRCEPEAELVFYWHRLPETEIGGCRTGSGGCT